MEFCCFDWFLSQDFDFIKRKSLSCLSLHGTDLAHVVFIMLEIGLFFSFKF